MRESQIEARMGQVVKKRGGLYYKFVSPGNPGVPDRIIVTPDGRVVWVELKTEVGRLSNLQKWQLDELRKHKQDVRKVSGWDEARACVEDVFGGGDARDIQAAQVPDVRHPKDSRSK